MVKATEESSFQAKSPNHVGAAPSSKLVVPSSPLKPHEEIKEDHDEEVPIEDKADVQDYSGDFAEDD